MKRLDFIADLENEVATILSSEFEISVARTDVVPRSNDPAITFPNVDNKRQSTKLLTSCVLYIDIRRSTQLNLGHRSSTVAKLYSAFVRAMTRCARQHDGHVRGIIGDRVMVVFDAANSFANAVNCAIEMNSAAKYVINRHFKANEMQCGIGVDSGNMLVTKTGVRRHGVEQAAYRNLVWLGRPANVASKLTDLANKPADTYTGDYVDVAMVPGTILGGLMMDAKWQWTRMKPWDFVRHLTMAGGQIVFNNLNFRSLLVGKEEVTLRPATPPILMTRTVWEGFRKSCPEAESVKNGWFKPVSGLDISGYSDTIYGGDVVFTAYKNGR